MTTPDAPKPKPAKGRNPDAIQVYPDPSQASNHTNTSTDVRLLREEVMNELDEEPGFHLPPISRIAMWVLAVACLALTLVLWQFMMTRPWQPAAPPPVVAQTPPLDNGAPVTPAPTPKPVTGVETNTAEPPELTSTAAQLAELSLLGVLIKEDRKFDHKTAMARLKPYTDSANQKVRAAAHEILVPVLERIDGQARTNARTAAEEALDLAGEQKFLSAIARVDAAMHVLPEESPWAMERGRTQLEELRTQLTQEREKQQVAALADVQAKLEKDATAANKKLDTLVNNSDPDLQKAARELQTKIKTEAVRKRAEELRVATATRTAWLEFLQKYSTSILDGDYSGAEKLCAARSGDAILAQGGVDVAKVMQGFSTDASSISRLYDSALEKAKDLRRNLDVTLHNGKRMRGSIESVDGRQLKLAVRGGVNTAVKIDLLPSAGLEYFLTPKDLSTQNLQRAFWSLKLCENPESAPEIKKAYADAKLDLPPHLTERLRIERYKQLDQDVGQKLFDVSEAMKTSSVEKIKEAVKAARPSITALEEFEPLSEARQVVIGNAEQMMSHANQLQVILQNGVSPNPDYIGVTTDQISDYRDSLKKTDVDVLRGLKVGSAGGLKRILIRFEGLETYVRRGRIKKATLELYQTDLLKEANGAQIGLYRLKRPWVPDQGTWLSYDNSKALPWAFPGASGGEDINTQPDTNCFIDKLKGVWRAWDVTLYVRDILNGQQQNNGFLMRITQDEPAFHVRFYPETDLEPAKKDIKLRPRVVIEFEDLGQ